MQNNNIKYIILLIFFTLVNGENTFGQVNVQIHTIGKDNIPVERAEILTQQGDSTIDFCIMSKDCYTLTLPKIGTYSISISCLGYNTYKQNYTFTKDCKIDVILEKNAIQLSEVKIQGKCIPKTTATGEKYVLSKKAKESGNPFRALSEIPLLKVDISNQIVEMNNGEKPLILINGKLFNSGIAPIDPSRIESVEISEIVSARYIHMGVSKILNIHLKKDTPWYIYTDLRTRHDIPLREGFGGANFEFGKKKVAVAGSLFTNYLHNDRMRNNISEHNGDISKKYEGESKTRNKELSGYLLFKWQPSESNYFSAFIRGKDSHTKENELYDGLYNSYLTNEQFSSKQFGKIKDGGLLGSVYHEHCFKNNSTLSSYAKYNYGYYDSYEDYKEIYDTKEVCTLIDTKTKRDQYTLSIDYDGGEQPYGNIATGISLEYTIDKDDNYSTTSKERYNTKRSNNFAYISYASNIENFYYMGSIGLQYLTLSAESIQTDHWRPKASASITWRLPKQQLVRGSYYLSNSLPASSQLTSYNTSTNPWYQIKGNPFLVPVMQHELNLSYDKTLGNFRLRLYSEMDIRNKMIESYVRDNDGIQIESYCNNGTYHKSTVGTLLSYRSNAFVFNLSGDYNWNKYNHQSTKGYVDLQGYIRWDFGNFFLYSTIEWQNRSYTAIAMTEYKNPIDAHIQLAWQINKQLYASIALPYYWGTKRQITNIENKEYKMSKDTFFKSSSLRPWLLLSWTLRKNPKLAINKRNPDQL